MLNRQLLPQLDAVRQGGWGARDVLPPRRLKGQRLGLIGSGNIGVATAAKARGLELETVAYDPFLQQRNVQIPDVPLLPLDEVLATSDYVSIHCPLNASTFHSIGARELGLIKPSAFLINCARGAIVDQAALAAALAAKQIPGLASTSSRRSPSRPTIRSAASPTRSSPRTRPTGRSNPRSSAAARRSSTSSPS